ncbi:competence protein ComK [Lactiplantibacillus songbeiensis]|uniref:Competence protein ComK n=1 Tax=Lactiplantibacillus songbeiensis TaxID=2559920 RepID=A0ABW4C352_9LACO|nr:competence protein ComK [Lactiplantibacillus songbeiensis]
MEIKYRHRVHRDKQYWPGAIDCYDLTDLEGLLVRGERIDGVQVDYLKTFFVLDTRHLVGATNAIILDSERGIVSTKQTVAQLMRTVRQSLRVGAQQRLRDLATIEALSRHKLPIICRDMQFLPVTFRNLPGHHWFGGHQFLHADAEGTGTVVQLWNGVRLEVPITKRAFMKQVERVQLLQLLLAEDDVYYERYSYGGQVGGKRLADELEYAGYRNFSQRLNQEQYGLPVDDADLESWLLGYFGGRYRSDSRLSG